MRSPEYPADLYPTDGVDLVGAYMRFIAQNEQGGGEEIMRLPRGSLRRASLMIAQACIIGCEDMERARKVTEATRIEILKHNKPMRQDYGHVLDISRLIDGRGDPAKTFNRRRAIYKNDTALLEKAASTTEQLYKDKGGSEEAALYQIKLEAGKRSEHRTLSLLNRSLHPWMMAVRALPHQDKREGRADNRHTNFDMVIVEDSPLSERPIFSKLQVKSDCFGTCGRPENADELRRRQQTAEFLRSRYNPDITLISGCCDFVADNNRPGALDVFVRQELIAPPKADIMMHRNRILEIASSQIMLLATGGVEAGRNGTYDPTVPTLAYPSS